MSDVPLRVETTAYLVCATQRSGSTLLCELLKGSEVAGVPDEYFENLRSTGVPRQPRQYFRPPLVDELGGLLHATRQGRAERSGEFQGWFAYALQRGTSGNGVFGSKMMWNYFDDFRDRVRELPGLGDVSFNEALDVIFPRLQIVFVRRRDKVAQAVSLWKALQTQQWRIEVDAGDGTEIRYSYPAIKHLVTELHRWDANWEDWFHHTGRDPIRVIYEEFVGARAATVGRVLDSLGIHPREISHDKGPMRQQSNSESADWVARFRHEDAEQLFGAG